MNRWREVLLDPNVHFPGESSEYRRARNDLSEAEAELQRQNEKVAALRRALPAGGLIREDYVFESAADGSKVRFSELFAPGKDSLVIYNMMFPRWSEDRRAGAPGGKTAELPLVDQPCPSCTSVVDGLEGAAFHLAERTNLVVIAKTSPDRLGIYAQERGWRNLRLLSSRNNTFNRDYHAETPDGVQLAVLNVFSRHEDGIHHHWTSENTFKLGSTSPLDPVWPIFGVLDLIREGRGDGAAYPNLQYQKALVEAGGSVHYLRKTLATAVAATVLVANAYAQSAKPIRGTDSYISTENEPAPKLIADRPVPEALARGPFISTTE